MAAELMEIDDSLYRQVSGCYLSLINPTAQINMAGRSGQEMTAPFPSQQSLILTLSPPSSSPLSRQRYVLGDSAMHQMAQSSVFLSGMGALGVEIGWLEISFFNCNVI